ncbi:putative transmembrane protein [Phytophthora cinnamomi]|uniref:putative transmembrane protein n=1 Tax=Phytophthora cinnamomi TaxID=4785 RepID=UPI003559B24F|nr:putative transmembrane protein [Phytophthora cinnamomi]
MATLFGQSDFHHEVSLDSKFSPLEFLAKFDLEHGGWFEFQLDVHFSLVTLQESDDRIMLYLLACDESAKAFLSLPSDSSASTNKTSVPSYCAMPNRTLDYYCQSFPLENQSHDKSFYKSTKKIIGVADNGTSEAEYDILTAMVALHYKLMRVPLTQFVYSALSFATKSTAGYFASPKFNVLAVVTLVAQAVALAVSAEVALFIAAGWGITQATLDRIDTIRIRCVAIEWAIAFVMLKQLDVDSIGIAVIWGISWFSIVFLIHYYATANLKMLRLRYRIGEQVNIDTSVVMWKGTLFLHYRRLQKGYIFIATVASLAASDNRWHIWEWISVQGHEVLMFFFYAALSYICRSQQFRFSELETLEIAIEEGAEGQIQQPVKTIRQVKLLAPPASFL